MTPLPLILGLEAVGVVLGAAVVAAWGSPPAWPILVGAGAAWLLALVFFALHQNLLGCAGVTLGALVWQTRKVDTDA